MVLFIETTDDPNSKVWFIYLYIVVAEHEAENVDSSVVLAAESAPEEYPCQVSEQVLLKPLGLAEEATLPKESVFLLLKKGKHFSFFF